MSAVCYDNFQSIFNLVQGLITGEISIYFIRGKYTAVYYLYPSSWYNLKNSVRKSCLSLIKMNAIRKP